MTKKLKNGCRLVPKSADRCRSTIMLLKKQGSHSSLARSIGVRAVRQFAKLGKELVNRRHKPYGFRTTAVRLLVRVKSANSLGKTELRTGVRLEGEGGYGYLHFCCWNHKSCSCGWSVPLLPDRLKSSKCD
jgi:hypothetical protein